MSEPPPSKKLVPLDGTSREGASERLALVAARREAGDYHPMAEALRSGMDAPAAFMTRVGLVAGGLTAFELACRAAGIFSTPAETYAVLTAILGVFPAWGFVVLGVLRDRLDGRVDGTVETLRRWLPEVLKASPVQALYFGAIYALLLSGPPFIEPRSWSPIQLLMAFGFGTMCWGYFVAERVLHQRSLGDAALRGPLRALAALVAIPRDILVWMRRPSWARLSSGNLIQVPYFLSIWIAGGLFGFLALSFVSLFWWDLFLTRSPVSAGIWGVALAFELTVAACGYNELARASAERELPMGADEAEVDERDATSDQAGERRLLEEPHE